MVTIDEVAAMALAMPQVTVGERWGNRTWMVAGKGFAWERPLSKADVKRLRGERVPSDPIVAVRVDDLGEKAAVLAEGTRGFFDIEHFNGYPAVLIELPLAGKRAVRAAIVDAWLSCAPGELAAQYLAARRR